LNAGSDSSINRVTIGVHRTASPESIRQQIEGRLPGRDQESR
jgi:hypothetical protein